MKRQLSYAVLITTENTMYIRRDYWGRTAIGGGIGVETQRWACVAPTALFHFLRIYPALPRWAKLCRAAGPDWCATLDDDHVVQVWRKALSFREFVRICSNTIRAYRYVRTKNSKTWASVPPRRSVRVGLKGSL